ncbi:MAG: WD40 repeat domain-containing protein [Anaerolineales bacterium]
MLPLNSYWRIIPVALMVVILAACSFASTPAETDTPAPAPTLTAPAEPTLEWQPELLSSLDHEEAVSSLAFSPDGEILASGLLPEVKLWDAAEGSLIYSREHSNSVDDLGFSADGEILGAGRSTGGVMLSRAEDGEEVRQLHGGHDSRVAFSPNGQTVATGNREGVVWIWDIEAGELLTELEHAEADYVTALTYSPDGELLAAGYFDCVIRVWQLDDGSLLNTFERGGSACPKNGLDFSPDGHFLAGAGSQEEYEDVVKVWEVTEGNLTKMLPLSSESKDVAFSPDGQLLAVGAQDATTLWRVPDFTLVYTLDQVFEEGTHNWVECLAFSPDSVTLAVGRRQGSLELWKVVQD